MCWNVSLLAVLLLAGWQDWRTRTVSNWITIPMLVAGIAGLIVHPTSLMLMIAFLLTATALGGWMGGADWKVLIGLFGLWPDAGMTALLSAAVWGGLAMWRANDRNARFPGVAAFALGAVLTFFVQLWL